MPIFSPPPKPLRLYGFFRVYLRPPFKDGPMSPKVHPWPYLVFFPSEEFTRDSPFLFISCDSTVRQFPVFGPLFFSELFFFGFSPYFPWVFSYSLREPSHLRVMRGIFNGDRQKPTALVFFSVFFGPGAFSLFWRSPLLFWYLIFRLQFLSPFFVGGCVRP